MPDKRLEKTRESYQITNCNLCGKPTTNFDIGNICGNCLYKKRHSEESRSEAKLNDTI